MPVVEESECGEVESEEVLTLLTKLQQFMKMFYQKTVMFLKLLR